MDKANLKEPKRTFSWVSDKAVVRETNNYGNGVFAKEDIKKGTIVAVSGGYVMTWEECKKLPQHLEYLSYQVEEHLFIGVKRDEEAEDNQMFNHSCDPNLGQRGQLSLVTMRDIAIGEELTFDYAMVLCKNDGFDRFEMNCTCGTKNCRSVITDEDWKLPELQKRYKGYFQLFLEEKIKKQNDAKKPWLTCLKKLFHR
ncbi:MAG: SET domain-containing protein [Candidatus Moraniibacteriota bacterium]